MKKLIYLTLTTFLLFVMVLKAQDNKPDTSVNLALTSDASVSGSIKDGRGIPKDILYNPKRNNYQTNSTHAEYGAGFNENLGKLSDEDAFIWQVEWTTPKLINYVTFGGAYSNQPQEKTRWVISYFNKSWFVLDFGIGGWLHNSGIYEFKSKDLQPITATAIKIEIFSDGKNDVKSIHLRGRGGKNNRLDDSNTTPKATLIQLLPYKKSKPKAYIDRAAKIKELMDLFTEELVRMSAELEVTNKKLNVLQNRIDNLHSKQD